ncbi:TonB-dependent receptor [Kaistella flava (ex Peng et al. 2021)]|uniref:TonB-dependent receptor n=1 Tax=Kaistella flava (ex Peng et al. 2021) TaxID=2038776 RepID=A0A7M2Y7V4_9FLAO|nr:TonB-dependent receptor [Kaistella flava (ex Peng et al. 2021)]QOW10241.1 TonB-dependent receptor [Kaistella flava (ex Peng et al. 2021)]
MKLNKFTLVIAFFFVAFTNNLYAQESTEAQNDYQMVLPIAVSHDTVRTKIRDIDQVVITGTRTPKRKTDSPVIVNLINSKTLDQVVATTLSEGLKYQPGLRVETDCQTCNYTQLRINGLQGGYSQILINSRPLFSPLMGLYGMEQIPTNMIDRIEVVRGGVSALYGSSAIGGTVNVITKIPDGNNFSFTNTLQSIKGQTIDNIITGNASFVNEARNMGVSLFVNNRNRGQYDANGDNYSELPELKDNTFGANFFFKPAQNQKLELSFSSINEYRFGGEIVDKPAYLAKQSEERTHHILMGSADYSISFNDNKNSLSIYYGGQKTDRKHYTGINPDDPAELAAFFANPPYGTSDVITHQGGIQFNNKFEKFLIGSSTLTAGAEYVYDSVFDEIDAYRYEIDQTTRNFGAYVQNDWDLSENVNFLAGARLDKHNLVEHAILSPRLSLLYKGLTNTQFRAGWGTGFRAPQAFDTDLHIAFAGGGVSRIGLSQDLKEERSNSFTGSVNYDKATEHFIAGFTVEGFYTKLKDAFFQFPLGEDEFGQIFEKRNGDNAVVKGITIEARANFDYVVQLDAGFTFQKSQFKSPVENIEGLESKREFLRTPNNYGYATLSYTPTKNWNITANGVFTGNMLLIHVAGEGTGQNVDEYFKTKSFTDIGLRAGHTFNLPKMKSGIEVFGGMKNIFDSYQKNFDTGKNRDSNFIYGPNMPRTLFLGLRLKSI